MKKIIILITALLFLPLAQGRLLDKVKAVYNDKTFTLSQIDRIKNNLQARKNISPQIFSKTEMSEDEIIQFFVNSYLIKDKLNELGYVIGDDQVESQIKQTEKRLGLQREGLHDFLKSNGITFDEYFEIIRQTIEYNIFISRVIQPLISVTDQEIKNTFYKRNINNKTFSFKYNLVDFSIARSSISDKDLKRIKEVLKKFQISGHLPPELSEIQTNALGNIKEEGLTQALKNLLKLTDEGSFSDPILIGEFQHVFYVKNKDLVESEIFNEIKDQIREELFSAAIEETKSLWYSREMSKHFIKIYQ